MGQPMGGRTRENVVRVANAALPGAAGATYGPAGACVRHTVGPGRLLTRENAMRHEAGLLMEEECSARDVDLGAGLDRLTERGEAQDGGTTVAGS